MLLNANFYFKIAYHVEVNANSLMLLNAKFYIQNSENIHLQLISD
jgi:hypothetical protein